jgi:4-amino-4-deoxy-L-arabinose transferase-like glycosyltransferase
VGTTGGGAAGTVDGAAGTGGGAVGTGPVTGIRPAWFAAAAQLVVLTVGSVGYGFHRDELYFRMLSPAWGYVDQPPLTPFLARTFTSVIADEAWALRIPATVASAASVVLVGLIARELGGDRRAVAFAAWGAAFAGLPLALGHVLLTSTIDLPLTLGVVLAVLLALRTTPRWWLVAGAVAGVATWNRLLVPLVWFGVLLGLAVLGPRAPLLTRWPWLGAVVAAVVGAPNLVYQWQHDWPQLAMGAALSENNAAGTRADLPLILLIAIGPPLVVVWLAGAWEAWRLPRARWLLAPAAVLLVFTVVSAAQPHYPLVMLAVLYALGCLPLSRWVGDRAWRRALVVGLIALNAVVSVVIALPAVPVTAVGATPLPDLSSLVADQVGWPRYVSQVAAVAARADDPGAVVITSNYGEAGAVARYGPALGLPAPYSGQNDLGTGAGPPEGTRTVVFVGWQLDGVSDLFATCTVTARLDNGVGVDNEEQGAPVALCRDPVLPWSQLWPRLAHLD